MLLSSLFLAVSTCWYLPDTGVTRRGINEQNLLITRAGIQGAPPWLPSSLLHYVVLCQRVSGMLLLLKGAAAVAAAPLPLDF